MNLFRKIFSVSVFALLAVSCPAEAKNKPNIELTLIPPTTITNKVDLDIRAGIVNNENKTVNLDISLYLNAETGNSLLHHSKQTLKKGENHLVKLNMLTADKVGKNKVILVVKDGKRIKRVTKEIEIIASSIRSTRLIDGAWAGIYHWSEVEGKHWNKDIQQMTDSQWLEMVRSMHKVGMDMIVIQEVFRNEEYVGKHTTNARNYKGKAFYPSALYAARMPIAAKDPIEAILSEADKLNMHVLIGVGMFAWFDFTTESLEWHKRVAKELWDKYGHHPSFYAFYVSEESGGSLDNWENTEEGRRKRKQEIVTFFKEFKAYCNSLAPAKPVMLATNSMGVPAGEDTYPALLEHLDILCPFGFARMPEGDLTGKQAADRLQQLCDEAGSHLWFDLEVFLFNEDQSLYPRPVHEIIHDLTLFENFEKILCYQFPGVFNDPEMSIRIGEERTLELFEGYKTYREQVLQSRKKEPSVADDQVKPITGTWINLAYQDVRNKYTNPPHIDYTDPKMWERKIEELSGMGIEYLVFMAVANEGKAYYPSRIMPPVYPQGRKSPVDAIMDTAGKLGMKVFMSTGWAKDQDDNMRDPLIKQRQKQMMEELATMYGNHPAFYGWYLPVEDCLCPVFAEHAVVAVNELTDHARGLTPGKKILISPYGMVDSDFDHPDYEKQLAKLKVDIIAYQDEVGCVREQFPLPRLKENWKKLRAIHNKLHIGMWANCETFTWEKASNDRTSALIPAAYPRILSQQVAASAAGVDHIISFMVCGIIENPQSDYQLGQPWWSNKVYNDYMDWKNRTPYWQLSEAALTGKLANGVTSGIVSHHPDAPKLLDGQLAEESSKDPRWVTFEPGYHELVVDLKKNTAIKNVMLRLLNYHPEGIGMPLKVYLSTSADGKLYDLVAVKNAPCLPDNNHDAWIESILFNHLNQDSRYIKVAFDTDRKLYMDELFINPV